MSITSKKLAAAAAAGVLALGLAACSSDDATSEEGGAAACAALETDLTTARQAVLDALEDDPNWTQVMLAGDVEAPTQKYGLLVMPFVKSDAADSVTGTVNIDGGDFVIEAEDVDGLVCQIDQDGNVSEVTE